MLHGGAKIEEHAYRKYSMRQRLNSDALGLPKTDDFLPIPLLPKENEKGRYDLQRVGFEGLQNANIMADSVPRNYRGDEGSG